MGLKFAADAILVHLADPWDEQPEEAKREWLIYLLFGARNGKRLSAVEPHAHWVQRQGFDTPSMWVGEEGDEYRERYRRLGFETWGRTSDEYKARWLDFLAEQAGRPIQDIDAELRTIFEAEPPEPVRRRRRRAA